MLRQYDSKISTYDKIYRIFITLSILLILVLVIVGVRQVFVVGEKIDQNTQNTQQIALDTKQLLQDSQAGTLEARKANIQRQEDLENYVKCLSLSRFDNPEIGPNSTKEQVEAALDKCAEAE